MNRKMQNANQNTLLISIQIKSSMAYFYYLQKYNEVLIDKDADINSYI